MNCNDQLADVQTETRPRITGPEIIHRIELREQAEIRVELIAGSRCRLGIYRASPSASEVAGMVLTSGFAVDLDGARQLRSSLALAIVKLESEAAE